MRDTIRLIATTIIWLAFTLMLGIIAATVNAAENAPDEIAGVVILAVIVTLAIAVTKSTNAIWHAPTREQNDAEYTASKTKRRRSDRMERLIDTLDDDDIYDLETLLLARDEELRGTNHTAGRA